MRKFRLSFLIRAILVPGAFLISGCKWESPDPTPTPSPTPSPTVTPTPTPDDSDIDDELVELSRSEAAEKKARQAAPLIEQIALTQANLQFQLALSGESLSRELLTLLQTSGGARIAPSVSDVAAFARQLLFLHGRVEASGFYRGPESGPPTPPEPHLMLPVLDNLITQIEALGRASTAEASTMVWPDARETARLELLETATSLLNFWSTQRGLWDPSVGDNYRNAWFVRVDNDPVAQLLRAQLTVGALELDADFSGVSPGSPMIQGRCQALADALAGAEGLPEQFGIFGPGLLDAITLVHPELAMQLSAAIETLPEASSSADYTTARRALQSGLEAAAAALGYSIQTGASASSPDGL